MKKIIILLFIVIPLLGFSQLINDGATITVESGAVLHVESDVNNENGGTIDIQGTGSLDIQGDLTIDSGTTFTTSSTSTVKFFGDTDSHLTSNGTNISNLVLEKNSANLILDDNAAISTNLDFNAANNKLILGANDLTMDAAATVTNVGTTKYIQANAAGELEKKYSAGGLKMFEVGDASNYSPIDVDVDLATSFGANASVSVNLTPAKHDSITAATTDYLTRFWSIFAFDMTSFQATAQATYIDPTDITGTESNLIGSSYDGTDWTQVNATGDDAANTVSVDVTATDFDVSGMMAQPLLMDIKVFLQGPYNGTDMNDDLRAASIIPTTSPYEASHISPATVFNDAANSDDDIVDWVLVELRDMSNSAVVLDSMSALLQRDGDIVDKSDGTSSLGIADPNGDGMFFIAVKHRNHLGFMSLNALTLNTSTTTPYDFTIGTISTYGTDALKDDSGTFLMWGGDANGDGTVLDNASPSDAGAVANGVTNHAGNTGVFGSGPVSNYTGYQTVYDILDLNMDGQVYDNASPSDSGLAGNVVTAHPGNTGVFGSGPVSNYTGVVAQLP